MSSRFRNEARVVNDYGADYMVWFSTFNSILVYNYFVTFTNPNLQVPVERNMRYTYYP